MSRQRFHKNDGLHNVQRHRERFVSTNGTLEVCNDNANMSIRSTGHIHAMDIDTYLSKTDHTWSKTETEVYQPKTPKQHFQKYVHLHQRRTMRNNPPNNHTSKNEFYSFRKWTHKKLKVWFIWSLSQLNGYRRIAGTMPRTRATRYIHNMCIRICVYNLKQSIAHKYHHMCPYPISYPGTYIHTYTRSATKQAYNCLDNHLSKRLASFKVQLDQSKHSKNMTLYD